MSSYSAELLTERIIEAFEGQGWFTADQVLQELNNDEVTPEDVQDCLVQWKDGVDHTGFRQNGNVAEYRVMSKAEFTEACNQIRSRCQEQVQALYKNAAEEVQKLVPEGAKQEWADQEDERFHQLIEGMEDPSEADA
jgi:hypothetical protein